MQIAPPSKECRRKEDECDLAEFCDGHGDACPEDVFAVNGLPCHGGQGYCYNGHCPQRSGQCANMYGAGECPRAPAPRLTLDRPHPLWPPAATEAGQYCYDQNIRGTYFAFCKRPAGDQYIPCQEE